MRILGCSARRPSISVQAYASQSLTKPFHCDSIGAFPRLFRSLPLAAAQPLCFVSPSLSFRCVSFALPLSSVGRHAAPCHFGAAHGSAVPFHRLSVHIYAPSPHRAAEPIHCVAAHIFASPFHCLSSLCSSAAHLCRSAPCEAFPSLGCACLPVAWPCHCASKHCASSPCRSVSWHLMASPLPFCTGPSKSFADLIVALPCFSVSFHLHSGRCVSFPKQRRSAQILSYAHLCYSSPRLSLPFHRFAEQFSAVPPHFVAPCCRASPFPLYSIHLPALTFLAWPRPYSSVRSSSTSYVNRPLPLFLHCPNPRSFP